jgi:hypothetical protein
MKSPKSSFGKVHQASKPVVVIILLSSVETELGSEILRSIKVGYF